MDTFLAIVQAISACAMAFFSYRLYYVSDQQRQLIARQVDSDQEAERGRLFGDHLELVEGNFLTIELLNGGRLPLEAYEWRIGVTDHEGISATPGKSMNRGVLGRGSRIILPGERGSIRVNWPEVPKRASTPTWDEPWYMEMEFTYTSYGKTYNYRWAWLIKEPSRDFDPTKGERYVGSGYERDLPVIHP
jgi:hypothetical protein